MGFSGDNVVIAGHSLGGIMSQNYAQDNTDIKAQVLMGSTMLRTNRTINNDDGKSIYNYNVPTLTIGGTKDGLMRMTRVTENYWTGTQNIQDSQKGMFPSVLLEGVSHWGFSSGDPPSTVKNKDLTLDVTEDEAHSMTAEAMVDFFATTLLGQDSTYDMSTSEMIMNPIL